MDALAARMGVDGPPSAARDGTYEGPALELRGLAKSYGSIRALGPLDLSLPHGTIGLVGPNGAGKTTLLRLLMGLLRPSAGSARILGRDPATEGLELRGSLGYMPEGESLLPAMSAVRFVAYMGQISGLPKELAFSRAHDILGFVGLREERYRPIGEYSVGMRQRVKLAQALVHDPPVVFLDEPTSGLDPLGRDEMMGLLASLAKRKDRTLVISTHLLRDVEAVCDSLLMLSAGAALAHGPLRALLDRGSQRMVARIKGPVAPFRDALDRRGLPSTPLAGGVELDVPPGRETEVFACAKEASVQLRFLARGSPSVEDLYLGLVERQGRQGGP